MPSRQLEDKKESQNPTCVRIATFSRWKTTSRGFLGKHTNSLCAICGKKYDWDQPNWLLIVQTGDDIDQRNVSKAHAVPQALCEKFVNALDLLASQHKRWRQPFTAYCEKPG